MEANDIDYKNLNFRSGDHILFFIFRESGSLVSLYLKLLNGYIRIIKAESDLKQFNAEIKRPEKKLKKKPYKTNDPDHKLSDLDDNKGIFHPGVQIDDEERYMLALESKESTTERNNQTGPGLGILTPDQFFSRLTILLAQLQAGNNSQK